MFFDDICTYNPSKLYWVLRSIIDKSQGIIPNTAFNIKDTITNLINIENEKSTPSLDSEKSVGRILATPTAFYMIPGDSGQYNRITRDQNEDPDNLLRIAFVDEDWSRLTVNSPDMKKRLKRILYQYSLCGKRFELLGYSKSQLKECHVYMIDPIVKSGKVIRNSLGEFDQIRIPGKYATRIGQCFATSE